MLRRRSTAPAALQNDEVSAFDRATHAAFVVTAAVWTGVMLHYGPVSALHHIAEVVATGLRNMPAPDPVMWSGQMVF